jgi:putative endopeptidase
MKLIVQTILCLILINNSYGQVDFLAKNIDKNTAPGTNFFQYANGGWIKRTPIPASESGWGIGNMVQEEIYNRILAINKKAAVNTKAKKGSAEQKIGDFWATAMDTATINKNGLSELNNIFKTIDNIKNANQLQEQIASMHILGIGGFFNLYIAQDDKNSEVIVTNFHQGGLGMPNREYYFKTDKRTLEVQQAYKDYVQKTLLQIAKANNQNIAVADIKKSTSAIFELEKQLATASRKLEDLRDPYKNYNKMTLADLTKLTNSIDFIKYAKAIGIKNTNDSIVVGQPEFFTALGNAMKNVSINTWRNYLKQRVIQSLSNYLDDATFNNYFNYRKTLSGAKTPRPRWKRMIDVQEGTMGELLGQLFAKAYFNETAKLRYNNLVEAIRNVYAERINKLDWMSALTKSKALEKLNKVGKKVGYPDQWKDFSQLLVSRKSFLNNHFESAIFWHRYDINKLGKPVNRDEWQMTPQTYNAYYNPSNNEIVLPAGIFAVPGMKDEDLDDAFVYGYAGASTIGHEITHGFDDQGRQYDAVGNLTDWWTADDGAEYIKRAKGIIDQFNAYVPVDTLHINGEATQGENIADLGGMVLGLEAFKLTKQYQEGKLIGGLTPLQRYFLGYAYGWMYQHKKEYLANMVMTDVHSPAKERVNGPVVNVDAFYDAFNITPADAMYVAPEKRVKIW